MDEGTMKVLWRRYEDTIKKGRIVPELSLNCPPFFLELSQKFLKIFLRIDNFIYDTILR